MSFTIQGGALLPAKQKLTSTAATVIVEGGQSGATVVRIIATELAGATPALTLEVFNLETLTSYYLRFEKPMVAKEEYMRDELLPIRANEQLRARASTANQIDVLAAYIPGDRTVS